MEKTLNPLLIFLVVFISWISLGSGSIDVNVLNGLWDWLYSINNKDALIIGEIRLPRTLLALVVGAAMGLSGAALQGLLRNPL
ncbi:MAG: iron chelate uptake ABC transporter family permease subunit, partial [Gammaproteobacteria bacterium]|nr:iron chelate uptake ABC transporter family permease subunit [Gammaproteobacteria bacterium]